jgi:tetratricopeptide (TPR) repeat protein
VVAGAGLEYRAHGYAEAAREAFQLALDRLRAHSPDETQLRSHRYNLGLTFYWAEQWEEARDVFLRLVAEAPDNVAYRGYLGVAHARLGNADEATRISDELAPNDRPYLWGVNTASRAAIAAVLGDSTQAVDLLRRAFTEGVAYGPWLHRDIDLGLLRGFRPFEELLRPRG